MTKLWQADPFHAQWDFMCAVYSEIRGFLSQESLSLQDWIQAASPHLGIVPRQDYMETMGWQLNQSESSSHQLKRTSQHVIVIDIPLTNGLSLFTSCLDNNLHVVNPRPIIDHLSKPSNNVILMDNRRRNVRAEPSQAPKAGSRSWCDDNSVAAVSDIFGLAPNDQSIANGVDAYIDTGNIFSPADLSMAGKTNIAICIRKASVLKVARLRKLVRAGFILQSIPLIVLTSDGDGTRE
jgi:hypothetical protein